MSEPSNSSENGPISVYAVLSVVIEQAAAIAWQKLGFQPDPMTNELELNLEEARVAIDLAAFAAKQLENQLDAKDRLQLENMVRDLRVNYVNKHKESAN